MGISLSCVTKDVNTDRLDYDMTPVRNKNLPIVWISGLQNTGKKTHGDIIKEKYSYDHINTTDLLRQEIEKGTEKGAAIREAFEMKKKVPNDIVIDLLKAALLSSKTEKGFIISNFPKNLKQADMFIREIGNVSFILHLYTDINSLVDRAQERSTERLNEDIIKRDIIFASRDIRISLMKFSEKIDNVNTSGNLNNVCDTIEKVFVDRLKFNPPPAITETDYIRQEKNIQEEV